MAALATPALIGRFELRSELGSGAQATVWLAWDAKLEREVAVKLLSPGAYTIAMEPWLHEARAVSRLNHPHVVPVFEAGDESGRPYLVFEYVKGGTLSDRLRTLGPMPAREAAALMVGVLDALAAAHAQGIVHRDLKPSNVLMGDDGRARVMDFGIAARVSATPDGLVVGSPGFMSPEAARGDAPSAAMDVFSAGMLMGQLLTGLPLLRERDARRAIERIQQEDITLPDMPATPIDDRLRTIVQRAIARDPAQRWADAAAMRDALTQWLTPQAVEVSHAATGTLEFLLRRMRHKSDFPAMTDAVTRIQRIANSEDASLASLSDEILKDVALTHKLLRLVNTAHFGQASRGSVSTVSRAVSLIGFAGVRNLALSIVLLEHMRDKAHAGRLKDEFLRSLMAAMVSGALCPQPRVSEEAFLVGLLQTLGRLLTAFYFPEEAEQIREVCPPASASHTLADEDRAARSVLGASYEELGLGVARAWGLPDTIQQAMRRPEVMAVRQTTTGVPYLRSLGLAGNDITDAVLHTPPELLAQRLRALAEQHARGLDLTPERVQLATDEARQRLTEMVAVLGICPAPSSPARRLLTDVAVAPPAQRAKAVPPRPAAQASASPAGVARVDAASADAATLVVKPGACSTAPDVDISLPSNTAATSDGKTVDQLAAAIQSVTQSLMAEPFHLDRVLRAIMQTLLDALAMRRIVLCMRDARGDTLVGRIGMGDIADSACKAMRVPLRDNGQADLFAAVCLKGADLLIEDSRAHNVLSRLPTWYRQGLDAPAFLLLPLTLGKAPFGLIYADKAVAGSIRIGERELSLVKTLRNQAVMAFKTAGVT